MKDSFLKRIVFLVLVLMTGTMCFATESIGPDKADFFVASNGSDTWSGTMAEPADNGADGPFATMERARDAVRELKANKKGDILVLIRGGMYQFQETLVFGLEDSGEGDQMISYAAYPGEIPVLSSGKEISGWKKVTGEIPNLPQEAQGNVLVANTSDKFRTLYDEDGMLPRSTSERFVPLNGGTKTELRFPEGLFKNWSNVEDVEILVRPTRDWTMNVLPLVSVDEEAGIARTGIEASYAMNRYGCWVENIIEELDEPGNWVLNTKEGKVYLWPRGDSPVFAPTLLELIRVEGKINKQGPKDVPVRNIQFRGFTFKHGERYSLAPDDAGLQHDWDMLDKDNALVRFRGAENCAIMDCHFLHSGSGAIRVDLYGMKNEISGNKIEHMGGGGILLCGYGPGTKDVNKGNLVYNNHIHHVGQIIWHSPGIFLWQSGENRVANNLIHHTNYSGMIISGCVIRFFNMPDNREQVRAIRKHEVGELPRDLEHNDVQAFLHSRNNTIEYNEIHHSMVKMGDGNGIYIRGAGNGNVIRRNYVHHLVSDNPKQSAIRTDGGQMNTLIAENVIYKCRSQGMTLKLNNRFENNIILDVLYPRGVYLKIVEGPMVGASNKKNIYYSSSKDCVFINEPSSGTGRVGEDRRGRIPARMSDIDSDLNIYYCKEDQSLGDKLIEILRGGDVDANSLSSDPMFVDPENGDFTFMKGSPALDLGIEPIDVSEIGLRK
ncbi:right-handed parallel beta-helix repeat-containing protein [Bacteroidota bacterium]